LLDTLPCYAALCHTADRGSATVRRPPQTAVDPSGVTTPWRCNDVRRHCHIIMGTVLWTTLCAPYHSIPRFTMPFHTIWLCRRVCSPYPKTMLGPLALILPWFPLARSLADRACLPAPRPLVTSPCAGGWPKPHRRCGISPLPSHKGRHLAIAFTYCNTI